MINEIFVSDLQTGIAGEHLVCADLILKGHRAVMAGQGFPYDVLAEIKGRVYKIQVKTTAKPKPVSQRMTLIPAYVLNVGRNGKNGRRAMYDINDVDIFAIVALDTKRIAYLSPKSIKTSMVFRIPELRGQYHNERGEEKREQILKMKSEGKSFAQIKKALNTSSAMISYYLNNGQVQNGGKKRGVYLDDFTLENCL